MGTRFTYEINNNNEVSIYDTANPTGTGAPNIFQGHKPNSTDKFSSEAEARAWAENLIDNLLNPPPIVLREEEVEVEPPTNE